MVRRAASLHLWSPPAGGFTHHPGTRDTRLLQGVQTAMSTLASLRAAVDAAMGGAAAQQNEANQWLSAFMASGEAWPTLSEAIRDPSASGNALFFLANMM